jgi:hypothetical protein
MGKKNNGGEVMRINHYWATFCYFSFIVSLATTLVIFKTFNIDFDVIGITLSWLTIAIGHLFIVEMLQKYGGERNG